MMFLTFQKGSHQMKVFYHLQLTWKCLVTIQLWPRCSNETSAHGYRHNFHDCLLRSHVTLTWCPRSNLSASTLNCFVCFSTTRMMWLQQSYSVECIFNKNIPINHEHCKKTSLQYLWTRTLYVKPEGRNRKVQTGLAGPLSSSCQKLSCEPVSYMSETFRYLNTQIHMLRCLCSADRFTHVDPQRSLK